MKALITGSTRGIGFGIAKNVAKLGFETALNGTRDISLCQDAVDEISKISGKKAHYIQGSIAEKASRADIVEKTIRAIGVPNLLVNNAGVAPKVRADMLEMTEENFDWLLNINLKGAFFLTLAFANAMIAEKQKNPDFKANIIIVSSVSAQVISENRADYCIAKTGLSMAVQLFASRLGQYGIGVFEIRPGVIKTDMTKCVTEKYDRLISEGLCVTKRWGFPDDIGKVVAAIARGDFDYSTGQIFKVDGGMTIQKL